MIFSETRFPLFRIMLRAFPSILMNRFRERNRFISPPLERGERATAL